VLFHNALEHSDFSCFPDRSVKCVEILTTPLKK
jgi:hypothetical protein